MDKQLPDKWIRKAIFEAINNVTVDDKIIPCYDTMVVGQSNDYYVILSTQSNEVDRSLKCGYRWNSNIIIDITGVYDGNKSGRVKVDNILDKVRDLTKDLTLDVASGLEIIDVRQSFPSDIVSTRENKIIYRKLIRLELLIN